MRGVQGRLIGVFATIGIVAGSSGCTSPGPIRPAIEPSWSYHDPESEPPQELGAHWVNMVSHQAVLNLSNACEEGCDTPVVMYE
mgnify:CR=1 FL=1